MPIQFISLRSSLYTPFKTGYKLTILKNVYKTKNNKKCNISTYFGKT